MAIVSISGPLILYARIGRLDLLQQLFTNVFILPAVYHEIVGQGSHRPLAAEIAAAEWTKQRPLRHPEAARGLAA